MSKTKMRCMTCGKWFQSANAKEVTCPDCTQKARKEKLAAKNAPPVANKPAGTASTPARPVAPPPKQKPAQTSNSHWFDNLDDVKVAQPDQPPQRPKLPAVGREKRPETSSSGSLNRTAGGLQGPARGPGDYRAPSNYRPNTIGSTGPGTQRPRQPFEPGIGSRGPRPDRPQGGRPGGPKDGMRGGRPYAKKGRGPKQPTEPRPKREKIPPPQPFLPTPEQIAQVEKRYLELAQPQEFDGIRTQIATEVGIPKKAVKKIVKDLRDREHIPSWWETQSYDGSQEELEKIKSVYLPLLPVPPVGVHKQIATQLEMKPSTIYQAIKAIRLEMNLPQYNDPILHGEDFATQQTRREQQSEAPSANAAEEPSTSTGNAEESSTLASEEIKPEQQEQLKEA